MERLPLLRALALVVLAALVGAARAPHPGPPVFLQVKVTDEQVAITFTGEQQTVLPWFDEAGPLSPPLDDELAARLRAAAETVLLRELEVAIDGETVRLELVSVAVFENFGPGNAEPSVEAKFVVPRTRRPSRIGLSWRYYEGVDDPTKHKMPVVIDAAGEFEFVTLTDEEPGFVWHSAARTGGPRDVRPSAVEALVSVERDSLPLFSIVSLAVGVLGALVLRKRSAPWLSFGVLAAFAGIALAGRGALRVDTPWGTGRLPDETQAMTMFRTLHEGVYGAFDAKSESEIYDRLARCVDESLIDELYGEIFESLVMREEGGAIAQVQAVDVVEGAVSFPEDAGGDVLAFDVDWTWRVRGRVIHYGHEHQRSNRYRARYRVEAKDGTWRISMVNVLENQRLPDPTEDA